MNGDRSTLEIHSTQRNTMMRRFARCTTILLVVGMLSGCSAIWIPGGFKLDAVELPILDTPTEHTFDTSRSRSHAPNTPPKITILAPSLEVELGTVTFLGPNDPLKSHFTASDAEDGVPTLGIVSNVDGPLPLGAFSFPSLGPRILTITATDSAGTSTQSKLTVNVKRVPFVVLKFAPGDIPIQPMDRP